MSEHDRSDVGITVEVATFGWEVARLTWDDGRCHVTARIPGQGLYRARAAAYRRWRRAGTEACLRRVADVNDGYRDSPPQWFWATFDKRVLAVMCGEWDGEES